MVLDLFGPTVVSKLNKKQDSSVGRTKIKSKHKVFLCMGEGLGRLDVRVG